jgi:hypothetical protein
MKKYNWKYITSGRKIKKVFFVCCEGEQEISKTVNFDSALRYQLDHPEKFENDIRDYAMDQKLSIEASWKNEKYTSKIELIKDSDWKKTQKQYAVKQSKF